jgi:hypothetical protein
MASNTPKPWRYMTIDKCAKTGEEWGEIVAENGCNVADGVYRSDAEEILAALNVGTTTSRRQP